MRRVTKKNPRKSWRGELLKWLIVVAAVAGVAVFLVYGIWAWTFDLKTVGQMPERSVVYDMDGRAYSRIFSENRIVVPLDKISKNFVSAVVAREDSRFYQHHG